MPTLQSKPLIHACLNTLHVHGKLNSVVITPDNCHIVSCTIDGTIEVWELDTGHLVRTHGSHSDDVLSTALTPDGRHLITGSADSVIRIIDIETGQLMRWINGYGKPVHAIVIPPDGRYIVSGDDDGIIRTWDILKPQLLRAVDASQDPISTLVISPDGKYLVSSDGLFIKVWRFPSLARLHTRNAYDIHPFAFTSNGQRIVAGGFDDPLDGFTCPQSWDILIDILDASFDDEPKARQYREKIPMANEDAYDMPNNDMTSIVVLPDNIHAVFGYKNGDIKIWNINLKLTDEEFEELDAYLVRSSIEAGIETASVFHGLVHVLPGHTGTVRSLALTPDGRHLVSGSADGTIKVWKNPFASSVY